MTRVLPTSGLVLAACLAALPLAAREPCVRVTDPVGVALEDAIGDEVDAATDAGRYAEAALHYSPDFAFGGMVRVEATERGLVAAATVRAGFAPIDMALGLAEAGVHIAAAGGAAPEITIRLLDTAQTGTPEAWTWCDGRTCTVELFPVIWDGTPPEQLQFTLAHELFHAVQLLAYPAVDQCASHWWVEGTAEWFANLAIAGQDFSARSGFLAGWDADIDIYRLIDLDYEAVAFWFWAAERFGAGFPLSLGAFGNTGLDNVDAVSDLFAPGDWAHFLKTYIGGDLAYPDGRAALPRPDPGPDAAPEADHYTIASNMMTVPRAQLRLEPGLWRVRRHVSQPGSVAVLHDPTTMDWLAFTEDGQETSVFLGCDRGGTLAVAATGGNRVSTSVTFTVERADAPCDQCWHGTWELTAPRIDPEDDSLAPWLRFLPTAGGYVGEVEGGGDTVSVFHDFRYAGPRLTLRPDGLYAFDDPKTVTARMEGADGLSTTTAQLKVNARYGTYRIEEGVLFHSEDSAASRGLFDAVTPFFSMAERIDDPWAFVERLPQGFGMTCSGPELVLESRIAPSPETTRVFRRVTD